MAGSINCTSDYARLSRRQAVAVLAAIALCLVGAVAVTLSPLASSNLAGHEHETGNVALYRAEVDRIQAGEGYYQAAATELTARGYPTRSVFNWRTPLPMWLLGKLPTVALGKVTLIAMAVVLMLLAFAAIEREHSAYSGAAAGLSSSASAIGRRHLIAVLCTFCLTGALLPTMQDDFFVMPVLWAGVLLGLSIGAYGIDRPWLGTALGLAAVFVRELALPYALVSAGIAWRRGRRREAAVWCVGLLAWLIFFVMHYWEVSGLIAPGARAHRQGWIQCGGAGFVIAIAQVNAYLLLLPQWVTAVYLVAAVVGLAGWSTPLGTRIGLTTCLFLAAFAMVGQSFNQYWGCLIAPLLCFGVARLPASMRDLAAALATPAASSNMSTGWTEP